MLNAPASLQTPFESGEVVGGKYRIISLLGMGGVGRVYLARHIELDTEVAIKVLKPDMLERPDIVQRFAREARASVRLRSEHIARVVDVGSHEGAPYFVMEHMVGCNLLEYRQQANVDIPTLCELFIQACEGLAEAHAHGVVHRDIKSENLFVVRGTSGWRSLKVFDFGISKYSLTGKFSDVDLAAMRTEVMMGTPHYISPEQIRSSRDVDHRTDLWSLGAVMFEVLSGGILPFREERDVTALVAEVLERPHRSLLDVAPNVPERLALIVDRCLEKDRELRYQTAAEIALDLLPLAPVRARASAERAVSSMQAAGLMPVNGDMESLRPMPTERDSNLPRLSTPSQESVAKGGPRSGPRPSESRLLAAAFLSDPPGTPGSARTTLSSRAAALEAAVAAEPIDVPITVALPAPASRNTPLPLDFEEHAAAERRKRKRWLLLLVGLLAVIVAALVVLGTRETPASAPVAVLQPALPVTTTPSAAAPAPVLPSTMPAEPAASASSATAKPSRPKAIWVAPRPAAPAAPPARTASDSPPPPPTNKLELRRER